MHPTEISAVAIAAAQAASTRCLGTGEMHAAFVEALRQANVSIPQGAVKLRVRPVVLPFYKSLITATPADTDTYSVPNGETLLVKEIRGTFGFADFINEPLVLGNFPAMTPSETIRVKAANCIVNLVREDTGIVVMPNRGAILASMLPEIGGVPLRFDENGPGFVVPPGQKITTSMTLITPALGAVAALYGIQLAGVLLRFE